MQVNKAEDNLQVDKYGFRLVATNTGFSIKLHQHQTSPTPSTSSPMAILAWSTDTFLYTSKCSFFHQSKYTLFETPLLLPWTGDGFDYSCTYEQTFLVAILQMAKCTPEAPVSRITGFRGHNSSPIHNLQQVKKIVSMGRTSEKANARHSASCSTRSKIHI